MSRLRQGGQYDLVGGGKEGWKLKTVFIGSVELSKAALETLFELGIRVDLVCSLDESASSNVCDYAQLHILAERMNVPFIRFTKVNELKENIRKIMPDFLFAIGISQMIPKEILDSAKCTVGFHPTALPKHRGRAPIPWMILLHEPNPMITLFLMDEGMDSGYIIHQEPYIIGQDDHATEVYKSVCSAIKRGLRECVPALYSNRAVFTPQNHEDATYTLIRRPEDGKIDWHEDAMAIYDLIRAAAPPYPGAFTTYEGEKIIIKRASVEVNHNVTGIPGQIYKVVNGMVYICTKSNYFIVLRDYSPEVRFTAGRKFV